MTNNLELPKKNSRCAYYGRVSTPKQKLEHQREHVIRFCEANAIRLPNDLMFEDKEKRHKAEKREAFQRLLEVCRQGRLDWIIICSFDRWGVADVDEFFEFRRQLIRHDVQLWSVVDHLNLTSLDENDFHHIVALAVAATRSMAFMAERNILKMMEMAKQGWAATGNAPFGIDLVCYPLHDLTKPLFRVVRVQYKPLLIKVIYPDGREELTKRFPARDKKATGYRFEPTIEKERLTAVNLLYELYESGMGYAEISKNMWQQGYKHYDKPFQDHALETILTNPAYVGLPAWGKMGVGTYRILMDRQPTRPKRKATEPLVIRKGKEQWIQPLQVLFDPIVPPDLWERVQERLGGRGHVNPSYGKRRTKSRVKHPLNGKLFCPDCEQEMVIGSSMPAKGKKGKKVQCFNCGTYRRYGRLKCFSNHVGWDRLDEGIQGLLHAVKDRIESITQPQSDNSTLEREEWLKKTELGSLLNDIIGYAFKRQTLSGGQVAFIVPSGVDDDLDFSGDPLDAGVYLEWAFRNYDRRFKEETQALKQEHEDIVAEINKIGDLLEKVNSETLERRWLGKLQELEARKKEIEPRLIPLTAKARGVMEQLNAILQTIEQTDARGIGRLLDMFIEKVIPIFDVKQVGSKKKRVAVVTGFRFVPRTTAKKVMPEPMEIALAPKDKDSSPRPEGSWLEKLSNSRPARS